MSDRAMEAMRESFRRDCLLPEVLGCLTYERMDMYQTCTTTGNIMSNYAPSAL
jgi:hypothetical protein